MKMLQAQNGFTLPIGGFTLTELIITVSIITVLVVGVSVGGLNVINRSRALEAANQVREIETAVKTYRLDTHAFPSTITLGHADEDSFNELITQPAGIDGWNGPYMEENVNQHHWGGAIRFVNEVDAGDYDGDPANNFFIVLDDDTPGSSGDDGGIIPTNLLLLIDKELDDGNFTTGEVRGNGCNNGVITFRSACNELVIRMRSANL